MPPHRSTPSATCDGLTPQEWEYLRRHDAGRLRWAVLRHLTDVEPVKIALFALLWYYETPLPFLLGLASTCLVVGLVVAAAAAARERKAYALSAKSQRHVRRQATRAWRESRRARFRLWLWRSRHSLN